MPAIGLSMNTGFFAASVRRNWSRCGRPSTLSTMIASTLRDISSIVSYIFTPRSIAVLVNPSTRVRLDSTSGLPPLKAATIFPPGT